MTATSHALMSFVGFFSVHCFGTDVELMVGSYKCRFFEGDSKTPCSHLEPAKDT